jgi:hypothetical protein
MNELSWIFGLACLVCPAWQELREDLKQIKNLTISYGLTGSGCIALLLAEDRHLAGDGCSTVVLYCCRINAYNVELIVSK